jgi:GxxExxY protein
MIELRKASLQAETEHEVVITCDGQEVGIHRLDILVQGRVVLELKTVECLAPSHYAQVRAYLKATGLSVALLVNFSKSRSDFRRILA